MEPSSSHQPHMNVVLVGTWEALKTSPATIAHYYFNKTHLLPLFLTDKDMNHQDCLADTKINNGRK